MTDISMTILPWREVIDRALAAFHYWRDILILALPCESEIEHIGATAVSGCDTKGDVDILVRTNADLFSAARDALDKLMVRNDASTSTGEFQSYSLSENGVAIGVQLVVAGSELDVFSYFRDQLSKSNRLRMAYNALKHCHAPQGEDAYRQAKSRFIEEVLGGQQRG